jgi:hypothetical protein
MCVCVCVIRVYAALDAAIHNFCHIVCHAFVEAGMTYAQTGMRRADLLNNVMFEECP